MFSKGSWKVDRWHPVKVVASEIVDYRNNNQAIRLTLLNESFDSKRFLIFTNNTLLMNSLLELTYGNSDVQSADEKDFVNMEFLVWVEEHNGYLNIKDIGILKQEE